MSKVWDWAERIFGFPPKDLGKWFNFDTGDYDWIEGAPDNLIPYLPKGAARNLYRLYVEYKGYEPLEAAAKVLALCVGGEDALSRP